jgi:hypothetical protein
MRYTLSGPFTVRELGRGLWQVTAAPVEVYLRIAAPNAARALKERDAVRLELQWPDEGVIVTVAGAGAERQFAAESAIVHESEAALYDQLPLATFDVKAMRFWRRVFMLLRLPGGRFLLRYVARR